jgi:protein SCO1/2
MHVTHRILYIAIAATALVLIGAATLLYLRLSERQVASIGGAYELTDHFGKQRKSSSFDGKLQIVYFGYTFCPDVCPLGLQTIAEALDILGPDGKKFQPIFITIDPARDSVKILAEYMPAFGKQFVGLTGSEAEIKSVLALFKVYAKVGRRDKSDPDNYLMDHSSFTYVMDRNGHYKFFIPHGQTPKQMAEALKKTL